jgi:excisionase family DNA binding protein
MSDPQIERFLNATEAANFLGITKSFLYKWSHQVPHYRIGSRLAFKASELSEWVKRVPAERPTGGGARP